MEEGMCMLLDHVYLLYLRRPGDNEDALIRFTTRPTVEYCECRANSMIKRMAKEEKMMIQRGGK
jgi:hypothetical protein